jgi:hypothetical protein
MDESGKNRINTIRVAGNGVITGKVYVNYYSQGTGKCYHSTNIDGSLKALVGVLSVRKSKQESLGTCLVALLVQFAIGSRRHLKDCLESFIEAPLFLIATTKSDGLDRIVRFKQPLCSPMYSLMDDIRVDCGMELFMETDLQFFAIDVKLPTEIRDSMILIKMLVEKVPDLLYQLCFFPFHKSDRFYG